MRNWKMFLVLALAAAVVGLTMAHEENSSSRGRVHVMSVDENGEGHQRSWVFDEDRGFLGVRLESDDNRRGARIVHVLEDTAAERAGLQDGDVITAVDGDEVRSPRDLTRSLRGLEPGDEVDLEVERDGRTEKLTVELGEHPTHFSFAFGSDEDHAPFFHFDMDELDGHLADLHERLQDMDFGNGFAFEMDDEDGPSVFRFRHGKPRLGVQVMQLTAELREHMGAPEDLGILVGKVLPGTAAEEAGVQVGDLIIAVDDDEIRNAGDLTRALARRAGGEIVLEVVRDGRTVTLDAYLDEDEDDSFRGPARRMRLAPTAPKVPAQKA
jgi:predicted metalloprotease with PDZ domain